MPEGEENRINVFTQSCRGHGKTPIHIYIYIIYLHLFYLYFPPIHDTHAIFVSLSYQWENDPNDLAKYKLSKKP